MKKTLLLIGLLAGFTAQVFGASGSFVLPAATYTNFPTLLSGSAKVTAVTLTTTNNSATVVFRDAYTNTFNFTNAAYIQTTSYVTNYITTWTNYFGYTNNVTNFALVDVTNTIPATNYAFPIVLTLGAGTNSTVTYNPLVANFNYGIWMTNTTAGGSVTVTLTYSQ
jgi:hypothetical protein